MSLENGRASRRSLVRQLAGGLGLALAAAVPMLAVSLAWGRPTVNQERPAIAAQDEAFLPGRKGSERQEAKHQAGQDSATVLQEWTYTRRPKPSGGG